MSEKATILIVDDEPANLKVLTTVLQGEYRVRAAKSGQQALEAMGQDPRPDLVLLDIMMPEVDGFQVLGKMREDPVLRDVPVIFVTALDDEGNEQQGLNAGAVDYITKPIKAPLALARVRSHLALKAARDHLEIEVEKRTQELANSNYQLKVNYFETVRVFSRLVELREATFAKRVNVRLIAENARRISRELEMEGSEEQSVVFAALLSRIGTISLPERMLATPILLLSTVERHELINAIIGACALIDKVPPLAKAAVVISNQFERFDGSGYPHGKSGEDIPLGSRILAVARDFVLLRDGMIEQRRYVLDEILAYMKKKAGSFYDPEIVQLSNQLNWCSDSKPRPIFEAGLADVVVGMELAEVKFGDSVFCRDTIATEKVISELLELTLETGEYCAIKVRARQ